MSLLLPNEDWIFDYLQKDPAIYGPYRNTMGQVTLSANLLADVISLAMQRSYKYNIDEDVWYRFEQISWKEVSSIYDPVLQSLNEIRDSFRARMVDANKAEDTKRMFKGIDSLLGNSFVDLVTRKLEQKERLWIRNRDFDSNHTILNTPNGTFDLTTSQPYANKFSDFCKFLTSVAPKDDKNGAMCTNYLSHLHHMADNRDGYAEYLEELSGYICTGILFTKEFYWWYGFRDTGKSSLVNIWRYCLGDYAIQGEQSQFSEKYTEPHKQLDARLENKRLIAIDELKGSKLDGAKIKSFTSPGSFIVANKMHQNSREFAPTGKLIFTSNHYLTADSEDTGFAGRLRLLEFANEIPLEQRQGDFEEAKLRPEAPYILFRMIKAAKKVLQQKKLNTPIEILETTKLYLTDNDAIGKFLTDVTVDDPESKTTNKDLITLSEMWSGETGYELPHKNKLLRAIPAKNKKYKHYRTNKSRGITGLGIKTEWKDKLKFVGGGFIQN